MASTYDLRTSYSQPPLEAADLDPDPVKQLDDWIGVAVDADLKEPLAMVLSTVDAAHRPHSRVVLCRGVDAAGLRFYTNYESNKGHDLVANAHAAVLFFWPELERQIRVEGVTTPLSATESDAYFASRPRSSQIGAWASPQSQVLPDRATLERAVDDTTALYADQTVPRPPHWGGYLLTPDRFEFWQGRTSRLHDRWRYSLSQSTWQRERLAP